VDKDKAVRLVASPDPLNVVPNSVAGAASIGLDLDRVREGRAETTTQADGDAAVLVPPEVISNEWGGMQGAPAVRQTNGIWIADEDSLPYLSAEEIGRPPIKLLVSLVGRCNLRCFHCLGTSAELVRSTQDAQSASPELVDFIVDRVVPEVRAIRLGGVGLTEQLMSRTFNYFMKRMEPHAPHLGSFELVTNLSAMTEQRADLLARCLTEIHVSLEGIGDNFTKLRGFPWSRLVKNFQMLREAKERNPATRMKITLLVCAMSDTLDDLLRFDVFKSLGVQSIIIRELNPLAEHHLPHVLYREPERARAFIREFRKRAEEAGIEPIITIADRYDPPEPLAANSAVEPPISAAPVIPHRGPAFRSCTLPFEVLTVVHTGQFGVCCYITDLAGPSASLSTLNIMDVWNSPRFIALRRAVNSSSPPPVCQSCEVKVSHLNEEEKELIMIRLRLGEVEAERDKLRLRLGEVEAGRDKLRAEAETQKQQIRVLRARLLTLDQLFETIQTGRAYKFLRRLGRWKWVEQTLAQIPRGDVDSCAKGPPGVDGPSDSSPLR